MPRIFPQLFVEQYQKSSHRYDICAERGITAETVDLWEIGYDEIENAITIPVRDFWGNCTGMVWRHLDKMPKYKYNSGLEVRPTLVGIHNPTKETLALLVEGPLDAVLASQNGWIGLATLGAYLHLQQINTLEYAGINRVAIAFDHDKAGTQGQERAVSLLREQGFDVEIFEYPKDYEDISAYYGY